MKKIYVTLITALFLATSTIGFADGRHGGGGASSGQEGFAGTPFGSQRNIGQEIVNDDEDNQAREHNFSQPASPGAWSQGEFEGNANHTQNN